MKCKLKINAFSLVETLVTLATFGILLSMLSEILILNLQVSRKITARSIIREDLAEMTGLMQRDMRNASFIYLDTCGGTGIDSVELNTLQYYGCEIDHFQKIKWVLSSAEIGSYCPSSELNGIMVPSICRLGTNNEILYQTSNHIDIQSFEIQKTSFEEDSLNANQSTDAIIYFTIVASATNENWDITNQFRQVVVTTRNY